ncbi:MAG: MASE1 domain-containing protein [Steroidobacteraceae bacterium]
MPDEPVSSRLLAGDTQRLHARARFWSVSLLRKISLLAIAYFATGWLGLLVAVPPGYATAVWPPSGIALAGLLLWGPRVWPGVFLGSFLINAWVSYAATQTYLGFASLAVAASIGVGSTLQALLAAHLLRRWIGLGRLFSSGPATLGFAAIVALCCVIAATWGVTTLQLSGVLDYAGFFESWHTWWIGDVIGALVITPLVLNSRVLLPFDALPQRMAESLSALVLLAAVTAFVFHYQAPLGEVAYPMTFLPLPLLVWIACRTSPGGVALATCIVSAIAVVATSNGAGPFARSSPAVSLMFLQFFMALTTLTALTLASAVTGQKVAANSLRRLSAELEQMALTDELTGLRNRRGFLLLADQAWRLSRRTKVLCRLLFIDLDGLKHVNDTQGHQVGDALLMDAARVLNSVFRESDVIGRIGGDEFAVLELMDRSERADARSHRLQEKIDEFNRVAERAYKLSMSIGTEDLPAAAESSIDVLLSRADLAMYGKKQEQRRENGGKKSQGGAG